jgi:putative oxidoreductase
MWRSRLMRRRMRALQPSEGRGSGLSSTLSLWADVQTESLSGDLVKGNWFRSPARDSGRSLDIVRVVLALILATHPIHGLMHPGDLRGFDHFLRSHGFPMGDCLAWLVMFVQIGCSLALVARRFVIPACMGHILVLGMGIWLVHAPRWRTVGLPDGDHQPGAEFSVLMIACLLAVLQAD